MDAARYLLAGAGLHDQTDRERMSALAAKAQEGALSPDEATEIDSYRRVGHLVALLQSMEGARFAATGSTLASSWRRILEEEVWKRAGGRCEYCRMRPGLLPRSILSGNRSHYRKAAPGQKHGSLEEPGKVVLFLLQFTFKGPNIGGIDPESEKLDAAVPSETRPLGRTFQLGRSSSERSECRRARNNRRLKINDPDYVAGPPSATELRGFS